MCVLFCSAAQSGLTLSDPMNRSMPGLPVLHQLLEFAQTLSIESVMPSNHLNPLSSPSAPALNFSQHQCLFQWVSSSHQVAKVLVSASASVLPMNTQDRSLGWTDWISLQSKGFSSLPQHHSSKPSIIWCSAFFIVQLSHPYMTIGKTIALTRRT